MSSRQEEKEQRRQERLAREQAASSAARRKRGLGMAAGGVLALAALIAIVAAVTSGGGGGGTTTSPKPNTGGVTLPKPQIANLGQAARAAGCQLHDYPNFGQQHVTTTVTYKTDPPTSGPHNPTPASDGIFDPGKEPAKENYVHSLEHGRIEIQYRPGTPPTEVKQLEVLFNEPLQGKTSQTAAPGYKKLLFQNNTQMPFAVAAVAWQHLLGCPTFNPRVFDAIRDFSKTYVDTAPEAQAIPFPE